MSPFSALPAAPFVRRRSRVSKPAALSFNSVIASEAKQSIPVDERRCEVEDREPSHAELDAVMDAYWAMCEDDDKRIEERMAAAALPPDWLDRLKGPQS
jgi:hypothetical protein